MPKKLFQTLLIIALSLVVCLFFMPLSQATDPEPCTNGDCPPPGDGCTNGDCPSPGDGCTNGDCSEEIVDLDIKPGNIMINQKRELVVMDFGLAFSPTT